MWKVLQRKYAELIHDWERKLTLRDRHRRVFEFDWGLDWLGLDPGSEDPQRLLRDYARQALGDSEGFFRAPAMKESRREGNDLIFPSPLQSLEKENRTVACRLFEARGREAAVIVIPQWNADESSHVNLCRLLRHLGMTAVRLTLPFHEGRRPPGMVRADYMVSPNLGRTLYSVRQAVIEVRQLVDWLWEEGYRRIGVMGTSIGSCVGYLAFVHEPRLSTGVFNHVSSYFADVVWTGLSTRFVRRGLQDKIGLEDLRVLWAPISPWFHIPKLVAQPRRHLLITARYDLTFHPELSEKVFDRYRDLGLPVERVVLPCGHYTTARFPFNCLDGWHISRYLTRRL